MKSITTTQFEIWLKANNIIHEKSELFHDFIFSLFKIIEATYMGDDVTLSESDKQAHFNWCWERIITDFGKENIHFEKVGVHYEYFWVVFQEAFYYKEDKHNLNEVEKYFNNIFNLKGKKTKSELDMLADLYKILECSLKKAV